MPNVVVALHHRPTHLRRRQRSSTYLPQNPNIQKSNIPPKKSAYSESKVETSHLALNDEWMNEYSKSNMVFKRLFPWSQIFSKRGYPIQTYN